MLACQREKDRLKVLKLTAVEVLAVATQLGYRRVIDYDNDVRWFKNLLTVVFLVGLFTGCLVGFVLGRLSR